MVKILIIDDNSDIVRMLKRKIRKTGWELYTAENGLVGVEKAWKVKPDLILMDMHMPVMDGYNAVKTLRAKSYQGLIVALTASVMGEDVNKAIEAGCNHFMAKPVEKGFINQLKKILEEY